MQKTLKREVMKEDRQLQEISKWCLVNYNWYINKQILYHNNYIPCTMTNNLYYRTLLIS